LNTIFNYPDFEESLIVAIDLVNSILLIGRLQIQIWISKESLPANTIAGKL